MSRQGATIEEAEIEESEPSPGAAAAGDPGPLPCASVPLAQRVEAVLLCSDRPLSDAKIAELLGLCRRESRDGDAGDHTAERRHAAAAIHGAISALNKSYESTGRGFRIEAVAGGRQILTLPELGPVVARMKASRSEGRLTPAALETLAIIAYRQPILRADIESIRGVACGEVLRTLIERRLVKIVGRSELLGRPMLYGTTKQFLRAFGLARLEDLPGPGDPKGP